MLLTDMMRAVAPGLKRVKGMRKGPEFNSGQKDVRDREDKGQLLGLCLYSI